MFHECTNLEELIAKHRTEIGKGLPPLHKTSIGRLSNIQTLIAGFCRLFSVRKRSDS
jgi:hypothetical protein